MAPSFQRVFRKIVISSFSCQKSVQAASMSSESMRELFLTLWSITEGWGRKTNKQTNRNTAPESGLQETRMREGQVNSLGRTCGPLQRAHISGNCKPGNVNKPIYILSVTFCSEWEVGCGEQREKAGGLVRIVLAQAWWSGLGDRFQVDLRAFSEQWCVCEWARESNSRWCWRFWVQH